MFQIRLIDLAAYVLCTIVYFTVYCICLRMFVRRKPKGWMFSRQTLLNGLMFGGWGTVGMILYLNLNGFTLFFDRSRVAWTLKSFGVEALTMMCISSAIAILVGCLSIAFGRAGKN